MFKNKLLQLGVIILIALALITLVVVILLNTILDTATEPTDPTKEKVENVDTQKYTPDELVEMTSNMDDITTNLANGDLVQISIAFQMDSTSAKEEFDKLTFITKDIVNKILADMNPEDIKGSKGYSNLKVELMNKINPKLSSGKLMNVFVTKLILP